MGIQGLYHTLLVGQYVFGVLTLSSLIFISAPYGRFNRQGWGPSIKAKYGWIIMETPAVAMISYWFFTAEINPVSIVMILIWQSHYLRRTFHYPLKMKGGDKPFPILLVLMAILFNSMNGFINGYHVFHLQEYGTDWFFDFRFIIGVVIFYIGYYINSSSDIILSSLKKSDTSGYVIPHGGLFKYVSNPHYLGEIIEWTGWAVLTWSLPGLAFAFYTFANLAPRAFSHHSWYKNEFPDYPEDRKALIPFIA